MNEKMNKMAKPKVVGLTYNLRKEYIFKDNDPPDANAEFDSEELVDNIARAINTRGHKVVKIGSGNDLLKIIDSLSVDIVFNIAEGISGRNRESQVPIILEMMGIPFVGADGLSLGLTLDKLMMKKMLISDGIRTPDFMEAKRAEDIDGADLRFPLIVKPRHEGCSKGISGRSVVSNLPSLKEQTKWLIDTYHQPALVEEFIEGSEFTVAILGNDPPQPFPVVQIKIDGRLNLGSRLYTFSHITSNRLEYICPSQISKRLQRQIQDIAVRTYQAAECRDFGRADIRVDRDGNPYILEINPLPSLSQEDVFMVVANYLGISYEEMINRILDIALARYGLD